MKTVLLAVLVIPYAQIALSGDIDVIVTVLVTNLVVLATAWFARRDAKEKADRLKEIHSLVGWKASRLAMMKSQLLMISRYQGNGSDEGDKATILLLETEISALEKEIAEAAVVASAEVAKLS